MRHPIVEQALELLAQEVRQSDAITTPWAMRDYVQLQLAERAHEVFAVVFLDTHHRVIDFVELFRGTLTQTSVYPREVVIEALHRGAACVVLAHNHPSGSCEPSRADELLTRTLTEALRLVDVRVLDHIVVSRRGSLSFAERGLL
jgi:DNA repair protein RadC